MKLIGSLFGVLALLAMLVAFIPLLGWLNWLVIPFAVFGLIISGLTHSRTGKRFCTVVIFFGILRLILGGGIL